VGGEEEEKEEEKTERENDGSEEGDKGELLGSVIFGG
jgi:hypothetical protein